MKTAKKITAPTGKWGVMVDVTLEQLERGVGLDRTDRMTRSEREKRKAQQALSHARRARKARERDEEVEAQIKDTINPVDLKRASVITACLTAHIDLAAVRRARRAGMLMGSMSEEATFDTWALVNRTIAKAGRKALNDERNGRPFLALLRAAEWLGRMPALPDLRGREDVPEHAQWLLAVVHHRAKTAVKKWYEANADLDSLERLESVMADNADPFENFKADQPPGMVGARYRAPGTINKDVLSMAATAAITKKRLDNLTELLLDHLRSDELILWSEISQLVYGCLNIPLPKKWWDMSNEAKATRAKRLVRQQFAWYPQMMQDLREALEERDIHFSFETVPVSFAPAPGEAAVASPVLEGASA